jgi:hypothetical protein
MFLDLDNCFYGIEAVSRSQGCLHHIFFNFFINICSPILPKGVNPDIYRLSTLDWVLFFSYFRSRNWSTAHQVDLCSSLNFLIGLRHVWTFSSVSLLLGSWHVSKNNKKATSNPEKHQTYSFITAFILTSLLSPYVVYHAFRLVIIRDVGVIDDLWDIGDLWFGLIDPLFVCFTGCDCWWWCIIEPVSVFQIIVRTNIAII